MADKVDKLLEDYYSGVIDSQIFIRKRELKDRHDVDENVGGGRAQNKQTREVDNMIIRYESDIVLRQLYWQVDQIKIIENTWVKERLPLIRMHYDRRKRATWLVISRRMNLSESQCRKEVMKFKEVLTNKTSLWKSQTPNMTNVL